MNTGQVATIDDLIAFNQQLMKLLDAGLPIELGDGLPPESIVHQLELIQSRVGLQVSRGVTVEQALAEEPLVPGIYRAAWETWFHGNKPVEALSALTSQGEARREIQVNVGSALVQPLVVLTLVYFGFIYLVLFSARQLEMTYEQIHEPPSLSLAALLVARQWLPVWGVLVPLLVFFAVVYWTRSSAKWRYDWLPGRKRFMESITKASYAECLARLLESNHSLDASVKMLGSKVLGSTVAKVSGGENRELPAMLQWATNTDLSNEPEAASRAALLRFTARAYRGSANREVERWRSWLPVVIGVLLGGCLVLVYGVSLFSPMIELLKILSQP